jgi:hypothetical protein
MRDSRVQFKSNRKGFSIILDLRKASYKPILSALEFNPTIVAFCLFARVQVFCVAPL